MATIATLLSDNTSNITGQTVAGSITPAIDGAERAKLINELHLRGIKSVADTTALAATSGADFRNVAVKDNALFEWLASGAANGTTIFAASGGGVWSKVFSGGVATPTLATPELTLTVVGSTEIDADWSAVTDAANYQLYRAVNSDFTGETLVYNGPLLTFNSTGLTSGTTYYFRVRARGYERMNSLFDTASDATDSVDVDAELYIAAVNAVGTISAPNQVKVDTLFKDLKTNSLYDKIKALYLYHGNTLAGAAFNAKNPTNTLGAFHITWNGTPTLNANGGITPSSGNYGITNFHPDGGGLVYETGAGMGFYTANTIGGSEYTMGIFNNFHFSPGQGAAQLGGGNIATTAQTAAGFHFISREPGSTTCRAYRNGANTGTVSNAFNGAYSTNTAGSFCIVGGMKEIPSTIYPSTTPLRVSLFTEGLLASEVSVLNTLIQNYLA